jgi:hypothetical protein
VLPKLQFKSRADIAELDDPLRRQVAERVHDYVSFEVGAPSCLNRMLCIPPTAVRTETEDLPNGHRRSHGTISTPKGDLHFESEWSPESQTSWTLKHPVESLDDVEKIRSVPWEIPDALAPPNMDELPAGFEDRGVLVTRISSPFVCVAGMMPREWFLELCLTDLPLIVDLTEICLQRTRAQLEVLLSKPGIEYVWIGGSEWVTPPMASPAIYDALVQEQERGLIELAHAAGAVVHIHCHGNVRHALARTIERGADYTEPLEPPPDGDITMAEAKALADGRLTLGGNIECRVLSFGSEATVEAAVRAAFEGGKERFILRPSEGPDPRMSEREFRNYMRMIDVWEELSPME